MDVPSEEDPKVWGKRVRGGESEARDKEDVPLQRKSPRSVGRPVLGNLPRKSVLVAKMCEGERRGEGRGRWWIGGGGTQEMARGTRGGGGGM